MVDKNWRVPNKVNFVKLEHRNFGQERQIILALALTLIHFGFVQRLQTL